MDSGWINEKVFNSTANLESSSSKCWTYTDEIMQRRPVSEHSCCTPSTSPRNFSFIPAPAKLLPFSLKKKSRSSHHQFSSIHSYGRMLTPATLPREQGRPRIRGTTSTRCRFSFRQSCSKGPAALCRLRRSLLTTVAELEKACYASTWRTWESVLRYERTWPTW